MLPYSSCTSRKAPRARGSPSSRWSTWCSPSTPCSCPLCWRLERRKPQAVPSEVIPHPTSHFRRGAYSRISCVLRAKEALPKRYPNISCLSNPSSRSVSTDLGSHSKRRPPLFRAYSGLRKPDLRFSAISWARVKTWELRGVRRGCFSPGRNCLVALNVLMGWLKLLSRAKGSKVPVGGSLLGNHTAQASSLVGLVSVYVSMAKAVGDGRGLRGPALPKPYPV